MFHHRGTGVTQSTTEDGYYEGELSGAIIGCGIKVHSRMGPGLLESIYEECLCHEFRKTGLPFRRQVEFPVSYDGASLDVDFRLDLVVADKVVVEVKAVEQLLSVHQAQLLTYLRISGIRLGLLMNFNVPHLRDGIQRRML